jgi:hypothetical protein
MARKHTSLKACFYNPIWQTAMVVFIQKRLCQKKLKDIMKVMSNQDGPSINLDRVSHMIVSLREDGDNYIGKAKLMDTPMGNIAKGLIEGGAKLGVSSRGMGTLKANKDGINEVQDDFYLATAADIVADPSAPDAFVQGIMENKEWVVVNGVWTEQACDMSKKLIKKASRKELEEAKLRVFESFLNRISRKTKVL